jgi:hypothetical protein
MVTDILEKPTAKIDIFNQYKHNPPTWALTKENKRK